MVNNNGSATVKKPRSKVSRACENCRRRKIKCTGRQPCSNCVTYSCECVFNILPVVNGVGGGGGASSATIGSCNGDVLSALPNISSSDTLKESISSTPSSSESGLHRANDKKGNNGRSAPSDHVFDPVLDCVKAFDTASSRYDSEEFPFEKFAASVSLSMHKETSKSERDVADMANIQPVFGDHGLYQDDTEFQMQIVQLQKTLKQMKAIPNAGQLVKEAVTKIEKQVEDLFEKWQPEFDLSRLASMSSLNNNRYENMKSIETHLMKNKYSDQVYLTTFSVVTNSSKNDKNTGGKSGNDTSNSGNNDNSNIASFFKNRPLVDGLFGIYSPIQSLSMRGIGHFYQRCAGGPESKGKTVQVKESLYLLLKYFDICIRDLSQGCVSIASPLEDYLRKSDLIDLMKDDLQIGAKLGAGQDKNLISFLIGRLPQPFVHNLTNVTNAQLCMTMDNDFAMFSLLLKMFDSLKENFDQRLIKITSRETNSKIDCTPEETQELIDCFGAQDVLLALSYSYYNSTLYHFDECVGNLNYFELLISFLNTQIWLEEKYGFEKVLEVAISYSRKLGLFRWEFYVGLDEETAERRRKAWWELYRIEKKYLCKTGRLSSIDDSKMNCLLPITFRNLGFSDHSDFLSRVCSVSRTGAFDGMSVSDLKSYGDCAVSQVASDFYSTVLYNEHFTSIRNTAKPHFLRNRLMSEFFDELEKLQMRFDAIKRQTGKLFEIALSSQAYNMVVSAEDKNRAVQFAIFHGCTFFSILNSSGNLIARLFTRPKSPFVIEHCVKYATIAYDLWRDMTSFLLTLDDDYTVGRVFADYGIVCMLVASTSFEKCTFIRNIDEVVKFLRVVKRLRNITIFVRSKNSTVINKSKSYESHCRLATFVGISANNMLLGYMHDNKLDKEKLLLIIEQCAPDVADLPALVLNPKSDIYELLLQPVENSGFHLDVKRLFEKDDKATDNLSNASYPKTAVQLTPLGSESSPRGTTVSQGISPISPSDAQKNESGYPKLPSIKSLTSPRSGHFVPSANKKQSFPSQGVSQDSPGVSYAQPFHKKLNNNPNPSSTGLNLGTLDEFVNNGDLNDVFNTLWSDLDENNQILFGIDDMGAHLGKGA